MNKLEYPITYMNKDYYTIEEVLRDSYEVYKHNNDCRKQNAEYRGHNIILDIDKYDNDISLYEFVKYQIKLVNMNISN